MSIKFLIQSKKKEAGIYVRIKTGSIDIKARTPYIVNPENWSVKKGRPKNLKDEKSKILSDKLDIMYSKVLSCYNEDNGRVNITIQWLKKVITPNLDPRNKQSSNDLVEFIQKYIKTKEGLLDRKTTSGKYKSYLNYIIEYQKSKKLIFKIVDFGVDFGNDFEKYMLRKLYAVNTTGKAVKFYKEACNYAKNIGLNVNPTLNLVKGKTEKVKIIYLTVDEQKLISEFHFEEEHLDEARDWLLISCELAPRVSDYLNFNEDQISTIMYEGKERKVISYIQRKQDEPIELPLSPIVLKILNKRNGSFPKAVTAKTINLNIKEVCKRVGLTKLVEGSKFDSDIKRNVKGIYPKYELITSHIGRRSFASNYYGLPNYPTELLMAITGHKSLTSFLLYIGKSKNELARSMIKNYNYED
jgi:integrase